MGENKKIDKDSVKKYAEFLKETLDPYKMKVGLKSFNRLKEDVYTIHGDLKELTKELYDSFKELKTPYHKLVNFGGLEFDLCINQTNRYYSFVDWNKFLNNDYELVIEVPENYDLNYLVSTIIHEFRHIIDFTDENLNNGLSSFDMEFNLRKYNVGDFNDFFILVYISLEHELVARNNQIYPYIKFKELTKEQSLDILKKSFIWTSLDKLKIFNVDNFINKFNVDDLIKITNSFIKDVLYDDNNIIDNYLELKEFYQLFKEYFNDISNKWKILLLREVDVIYERKYNHNEYIDGYKDILKLMWIEVKKNIKYDKSITKSL